MISTDTRDALRHVLACEQLCKSVSGELVDKLPADSNVRHQHSMTQVLVRESPVILTPQIPQCIMKQALHHTHQNISSDQPTTTSPTSHPKDSLSGRNSSSERRMTRSRSNHSLTRRDQGDWYCEEIEASRRTTIQTSVVFGKTGFKSRGGLCSDTISSFTAAVANTATVAAPHSGTNTVARGDPKYVKRLEAPEEFDEEKFNALSKAERNNLRARLRETPIRARVRHLDLLLPEARAKYENSQEYQYLHNGQVYTNTWPPPAGVELWYWDELSGCQKKKLRKAILENADRVRKGEITVPHNERYSKWLRDEIKRHR